MLLQQPNPIRGGRDQSQQRRANEFQMKRLAVTKKSSRGRSTSLSCLCKCIVLLSLAFLTTPALAKTTTPYRSSSSDKETSKSLSERNAPNQAPASVEPDAKKMDAVKLVTRGGYVSLLLVPAHLLRKYIADFTVETFIKSHVVMIAKGTVVVFVTASFMAYLGIIGDHDHQFQDWMIEKENNFLALIRRWGFHPRGYLRTQLQNMLNNFRNMPPRPKFASAVSLGTTAFPLMVQTVTWTVRIVLGSFLLAEILALLGVLGKPGEGLEKWVEEGGSEPLVRNVRRAVDEARQVLRQKLQIQEILNNFLESLQKDDVYWLGFGVGALASMLIKDIKDEK